MLTLSLVGMIEGSEYKYPPPLALHEEGGNCKYSKCDCNKAAENTHDCSHDISHTNIEATVGESSTRTTVAAYGREVAVASGGSQGA